MPFLFGRQEIERGLRTAVRARRIVWPVRLSDPLGSGRATTAENAAHRVVQAGYGVRQQRYTLAMSPRCGFAAGNRYEFAVAFCSCLAERQPFTIAR